MSHEAKDAKLKRDEKPTAQVLSWRETSQELQKQETHCQLGRRAPTDPQRPWKVSIFCKFFLLTAV